VDRRDRAAVDLQGQRLTMCIGQQRCRAGRLAVVQSLELFGVEPGVLAAARQVAKL
jgi:hypothetical protein